MSTTTTKALKALCYKVTGTEATTNTTVKVIDEITANYTATATTTKKGPMKQGAAVANAAGSAPTAAEFKALLDSLRNAGIIASS